MLPMHTLVENYGQTPKLTATEARKEFPEECWEIATGHVNIQKWTHDGKQYMQRWLCQLGTTCKLDRRDLIAAAVEWLEGKELVGLGPTTTHRRFMPKDSLRWALEEVREHLKLKKKHKPKTESPYCDEYDPGRGSRGSDEYW